MNIKLRLEKLESQVAPKAEIVTSILLPTVEPGYVALLLDYTGEEKLLTQAEYDEFCAQSPNMRVIRPRDEFESTFTT